MMLFENAAAEMALLLFTLLVPTGVTALALIACVRGFLPTSNAEGEANRKLDKMTTIPAVVMLVGLICAFFHLGHPSTVFFMLSSIGMSPLSNEILVAAIAILIGAIYWIVCLAKGLNEGAQKACGVILAILALICAIFTGIAYSIPTIPTWDTPFNWIGQIGLALLGGSVLAAVTFVVADYPVERKASCMLLTCGVVGCLVALITLIGQYGVVASIVNSVGGTLAAVAADYAWVACVSILCMIAGIALWLVAAFSRKAEPKALVVVACILVFIGLAFMRICFYGIYLSAGLAVL